MRDNYMLYQCNRPHYPVRTFHIVRRAKRRLLKLRGM